MTDIENYVAETPYEPHGHQSEGGRGISPGCEIVSYWQGVVEVVLRAFSLFFVFLVFLTSAVGVGQLNDLSDDDQEFIDESDEHHDDDPDVPDTPDLFSLSRAGCGFLIFLTFPVVTYKLIVIVARFLRPGILIKYIIIVLIGDIVINGAFAFIYLVTGAVLGSYSTLWDEWADRSDDSNNLANIRGVLGATCAFCIFQVVVYIVLNLWLVISIALKWHLPPDTKHYVSTGGGGHAHFPQ